MKVSVAALITALSLAACHAAQAYADAAPAPAAPVPAAAPTINDVIDQTNFVVANQCSGTLISLKYRLVLTNNHCLEGYIEKVNKEETGKDGAIETKTREVYKDMELKQRVFKDFEEVSASTFQSKILFHTPKYDLALLQIRADTIPQTIYAHVLPADVQVTRGDKIYVVGNPFLLDSNLTEGVVSSVSRKIHWDETNEDVHYYGIDAGVNPGNSGGSLYNSAFQLIGVPAATMRGATGVGFAIPAPTIRDFLTEHCYEDVWNAAAKDKKACEQDKTDKVNAARAKAGLPPMDAPKDQDSLGASALTAHPARLDIEPSSPLADWVGGLVGQHR